MYLNTFIGLEENVTGYGAKQKRPSGHVTISTPGVIKCYVQDLRPLSTKDYVLYAMGKDKKAVRLGKLNSPSQNKQTLWNIDIDNVNGQNINAKDIDCVAVVIEGESIGNTDTIMIGHMKDKYLITSLLEMALPKKKVEKEVFTPQKVATVELVVPVTEITEEPTLALVPEEEVEIALAPEEEVEIALVPEEVEIALVPEEAQVVASIPNESLGPVILDEDKQELKECLNRQVDLLNEQIQALLKRNLHEECSREKEDFEINLQQKVSEVLADDEKVESSGQQSQAKKDNYIKNILSQFIKAQQESDILDQGREDSDIKGVEEKEDTRFNEIEEVETTVEETDYLKALEDRLKDLKNSLIASKENVELQCETKQATQAVVANNSECEPCKKKQTGIIKGNQYNRVKEVFESSTPTTPFKAMHSPISWVMMSTAELISMPELSYEWCTQPFITYCYHKFNHLILGKDNEIEQYYVGIPDVYHPSRRYILALDKIEGFRCCEDKNPSAGDFGYWIARI